MSRLDMQIEKTRKEMHNLINLHNDRTAEEVVQKSQELDVLIVLKQQEDKNGKVLF